MKMKFLVNLLVVGLLVVGVVNADDSSIDSSDDTSIEEETSISDALDTGLTEFTLNLYKKLIDSSDNLVLSPYSIRLALAAVYNFVSDETMQTNIKDILKLQAHELNPNNEFIKYKSNSFVRIANKVVTNSAKKLASNFQTKLAEVGLSATEVDLSNKAATVTEINRWVENVTSSLIKEIVKEEDITDDLEMLLLNAVTFKAGWEEPFKKDNTYETDFTLADGTQRKVDMMRRYNGKFRIDETTIPNVQLLELPYEDQSDAVMWIVLPNEGKSFSEVVQNLDVTKLNEIDQQMYERTVERVEIPRFKIENRVEGKGHLEALGLNIFSRGGISIYNDRNSDLDDIKQDAFINVNEEGTEAAAVTRVKFGVRSSMSRRIPLTFICNRPFLYMVKIKSTKQILYIGHYTKPEENKMQ
uniref:Putative salivary serpin n=1 Tax=Corethrella appendiculata TaxID=1370023 RepID=U5EIS2_9DIPT